MYTVKQLSDLAGVSVRTLHYYDAIGLLKPEQVRDNGYRYYGNESLLRLQQILFFKELDFSLEDIAEIVGNPDFDMIGALRTHKSALQQRVQRLNKLIHTVDQTIEHINGSQAVEQKDLFAAFTDEQQAVYEKEAYQRWGDSVKESSLRWKSHSAEKRAAIMREGSVIYTDLVAHLESAPDNPEVQTIIARWHQHLRYFYEPTPDVLLGLANAYSDDPAFAEFFTKIHPDLAAYFKLAVPIYVESIAVRS
jgi:DNA-binding transcriptional MerR regulator